MKSFWIFLIGTILVVAGVTFGMSQVGVPPIWIGITVLIILGIAVASGAGLTKKRKSDSNTVVVNESEHD